jgi:hypothetical protein
MLKKKCGTAIRVAKNVPTYTSLRFPKGMYVYSL